MATIDLDTTILTPIEKYRLQKGDRFIEGNHILTVVATGAKQGSGSSPSTAMVATDDGEIDTFNIFPGKLVVLVEPKT